MASVARAVGKISRPELLALTDAPLKQGGGGFHPSRKTS